MIEKTQQDPLNYKINMFYYHSGRDALFDVVQQLNGKGYNDIFIPGYIGWSPREGSGIFDPLNKIKGLSRHYYRMTRKLMIDVETLIGNLKEKSILLVVNYFGFRDKNISNVIDIAKEKDCVIIEDNAHGFFTFFCNEPVGSDLTFFSLHKMFPFRDGGSLLFLNNGIGLKPELNLKEFYEMTPFSYDINGIARKRINNYKVLMALMEGKEEYFTPLKTIDDLLNNVPQTFPVIIKKGNRNRIYEIMNNQGLGVVSLYHTMIDELKSEEHSDACWLSEHILNLPVHQDCDEKQYPEMIRKLKEACINS